jgi:hypothetical protein
MLVTLVDEHTRECLSIDVARTADGATTCSSVWRG